MRYAVVIEKTDTGHSAYVPDLPGCVATGSTLDEVRASIAEAVAMHVAGLVDDGEPIPEPSAVADYIETDAA